jgi:ParB family transcriptional regulator, chromosome partitioning protein
MAKKSATAITPYHAPLGNAFFVPCLQIEANPFQPRRLFTEAEMLELVESIKEHGLLQPVLIRPIEGKKHKGVFYQLVAGERRWRAAQRAGREQIPAIIRELSDVQALEIGLDENIQRESLTDYEEADGLRRLFEIYEQNGERVTREEMARRRNKSIKFINNRMSLLMTKPDVLELAQRHRNIISSALAIDKVSDSELRRELIQLVDAGGSYQAVTTRISDASTHVQLQNESQRAPDKETASRSRAFAQRGGGSVSRGRQLTTQSATDAKQEVEQKFSEVESALVVVEQWWPHLSDAQRTKFAPRLRSLRARVSRLESD